MTEKQLKVIKQKPRIEQNSMYDSPKYITEDHRLIASHHSNQKREDPLRPKR